MFTLPSWPASASRRSTASCRSSTSSKAKSSVSAMPPTISRTTARKSRDSGVVSSIRSTLTTRLAIVASPTTRSPSRSTAAWPGATASTGRSSDSSSDG